MALTLVSSDVVVTPTTATGGQVESIIVQRATTATNLLVAYMGYDLDVTPSAAATPSFNVTDSASNIWIPVAMSAPAVYPNRCAVWVCPNAQATTWVSMTVNGYVSNAVAILAQFSGAPAFPKIDLLATAATASNVTSQTPSSTATAADYVFGCWVTGSLAATYGTLTAPAGLTQIVAGGTPAGGSNPNPVTLDAVYGSASAGTVSAAWATTNGVPMASVLIGITQANFPPTQPSANFPAVKVEAAFDSSPADPTASVMWNDWTDITIRAIGKQGTPIISGLRGKTYELTTPETGTLNIGLRNDDGAFNPLNTASPYWTNATNTNPTFANGSLSGWQGNNNATAVASQAVTFSPTPWAALVTPDGVTANPGMTSTPFSQVPILPSLQYSASAWFNCPAGWATGAQVDINWFTSGGVYISTSASSAVPLTAGTWTQVSRLAVLPPTNAAFATVIPQLSGTPSAATIFYVSQAGIATGTESLETGLITLNTPIRVTAFWNGTQYNLFTGYVSRWPQDWPDMPQYGFSRLEAVDIAGLAAVTNLPSAVQGEILVDAPYACFPFNEQYTTTSQAPSSVFGAVQTVIDADGLSAYNTARTNQRPGTYQDGELPSTAVAPINTGQTLGLLGDNANGMGTTAFSGTSSTSSFRGPGVIYADAAGSPSLVSSGNGFTVEMLVNVSPVIASGSTQNTLILNVMGPPVITGSTPAAHMPANQGVIPTLQVFVNLTGSTSLLCVDSAQYGAAANEITVAFTNFISKTVHLAITMTSTTTKVYLNGTLAGSSTGLSNLTDQIQGWSFGQAHWAFQFEPFGGNYVMQYGTIYPYQVPASRILQHANCASSGFQGDDVSTRFGRYLAWAGGNFNPGAWPQSTLYAVELGAAYDTSSTTLSDALNNLTTTDGGLWYTNAAGCLVLAPRTSLYDRPSSATFGDSNTPAAEVAYLPNFGIDYDNAYLYNSVQVTQYNGPSTLSAPVFKNSASTLQYGTRGPLSQAVSTTDGLDVYDRLFWSLNKYDQPSERVRVMTIDAAAQTSAFATCLALDVTDVVTVNRRPLGATANYNLTVLLQQIGFSIGPGYFNFNYIGTPYTPEGATLVADSSFDVIGSNALAW